MVSSFLWVNKRTANTKRGMVLEQASGVNQLSRKVIEVIDNRLSWPAEDQQGVHVFWWSLIPVASLMIWSICLDFFGQNTGVLQLVAVSQVYAVSTAADLPGWTSWICQRCWLTLVSMERPVCPLYILPHLHGMQHTPDALFIIGLKQTTWCE
jgi:hypothetical protein